MRGDTTYRAVPVSSAVRVFFISSHFAGILNDEFSGDKFLATHQSYPTVICFPDSDARRSQWNLPSRGKNPVSAVDSTLATILPRTLDIQGAIIAIGTT